MNDLLATLATHLQHEGVSADAFRRLLVHYLRGISGVMVADARIALEQTDYDIVAAYRWLERKKI